MHIVLVFGLCFVRCSHAALSAHASDPAEELLLNLRHSIFVERRHTRKPPTAKCSSLGGPACFALGHRGGLGRSGLGGVIPEQLLADLAGRTDAMEFVTPTYEEIEFVHKAMRKKDNAASNTSQASEGEHRVPRFPLHEARANGEVGYLHFGGAETQHGSSLPAQFSRGLPASTVASWDGTWLVRPCSDCSPVKGADNVNTAALPAPSWLALPSPGTSEVQQQQAMQPRSEEAFITTVAQIQSTVSYIRFSQPVVVRSLWARWRPDAAAQKKPKTSKKSKGATLQQKQPPAMIAGRLGISRSWVTQMDPKRATGRWVDIGGGPLSAVDELVFVAAAGLEVGFIEAAATRDLPRVDGAGADAGPGGTWETNRKVLVLTPTPEGVRPGASPFTVTPQVLSAASAPFVMTLQDVIEQDLDLVAKPEGGQDLGPGVFTSSRRHQPQAFLLEGGGRGEAELKSEFVEDYDEEEAKAHAAAKAMETAAEAAWQAEAAANEQALDHASVSDMLVAPNKRNNAQLGALLSAFQGRTFQDAHDDDDDEEDIRDESFLAIELRRALRKNSGVPADLRKQLKRRKSSILDSASRWVRSSAKRRSTEAPLPGDDAEAAWQDDAVAKSYMCDLDILAAAMLYMDYKGGSMKATAARSKTPSLLTGGSIDLSRIVGSVESDGSVAFAPDVSRLTDLLGGATTIFGL